MPPSGARAHATQILPRAASSTQGRDIRLARGENRQAPKVPENPSTRKSRGYGYKTYLGFLLVKLASPNLTISRSGDRKRREISFPRIGNMRCNGSLLISPLRSVFRWPFEPPLASLFPATIPFCHLAGCLGTGTNLLYSAALPRDSGAGLTRPRFIT